MTNPNAETRIDLLRNANEALANALANMIDCYQKEQLVTDACINAGNAALDISSKVHA